MDFEVPVCKNYATKSHKICWVSRIYNKECIEVFLMQWTFSKVVYTRNAHGHIVKNAIWCWYKTIRGCAGLSFGI